MPPPERHAFPRVGARFLVGHVGELLVALFALVLVEAVVDPEEPLVVLLLPRRVVDDLVGQLLCAQDDTTRLVVVEDRCHGAGARVLGPARQEAEDVVGRLGLDDRMAFARGDVAPSTEQVDVGLDLLGVVHRSVHGGEGVPCQRPSAFQERP